jgi:putative ABC transport system permease protein
LANAYIINEALARQLLADQPGVGLESLIGRPFGFGWEDSLGTIVGIARDFHFNSLHHRIETLAISVNPEWGYDELSVRVNGPQARQAIRHLEQVWKSFLPGSVFEYALLDSHFQELYKPDKRVSQLVGILAGLAILLSCLGLLGLTSYSTQQRRREIGIRKVLGASVSGLLVLLTKDFLRLVLLANVIAWPLAWWAVNGWLEDFAYRIGLEASVFLLTGLATLLLALFTVSFQTLRAAWANPVKALRNE